MRCPPTLTTRTTVGSDLDKTPTLYMYIRVTMCKRDMRVLRLDEAAHRAWWEQHGIVFQRNDAGEWHPCPPYRIWRDMATVNMTIEQERYQTHDGQPCPAPDMGFA